MKKPIGILITNLGTPDAPTTSALRRYLNEFLGDPRVVEIPRPLWWLILHGIVLRIRPKRSAALYQKIWTAEGSPLLLNSQNLVKALQQLLPAEDFKVVLGMRYGQPSIKEALSVLRQSGCERIIILPLFPQYSAATTASTFDAIADALKTWRVIPELKMITHYFANAFYISALVESIKQHWQLHGEQDLLLFSFHGLPQRCIDLGDPYQQQCLTTAQLVAEHLQLPQAKWSVVFQSRFGYAQWLKPYCADTLQTLPGKGIKSVSVICPGFAVDCLETLEEINQLNRELFLKAGGEKFFYIPALNDSVVQVDLLAEIIKSGV